MVSIRVGSPGISQFHDNKAVLADLGLKHSFFSGGASGEEPACPCRRGKRPGFDPWVERIPWRRKWLQYSCLENPRDRGAWRATVHKGCRVRHMEATEHHALTASDFLINTVFSLSLHGHLTATHFTTLTWMSAPSCSRWLSSQLLMASDL